MINKVTTQNKQAPEIERKKSETSDCDQVFKIYTWIFVATEIASIRTDCYYCVRIVDWPMIELKFSSLESMQNNVLNYENMCNPQSIATN